MVGAWLWCAGLGGVTGRVGGVRVPVESGEVVSVARPSHTELSSLVKKLRKAGLVKISLSSSGVMLSLLLKPWSTSCLVKGMRGSVGRAVGCASLGSTVSLVWGDSLLWAMVWDSGVVEDGWQLSSVRLEGGVELLLGSILIVWSVWGVVDRRRIRAVCVAGGR